jgi:hypothetical protein
MIGFPASLKHNKSINWTLQQNGDFGFRNSLAVKPVISAMCAGHGT